MYQHRQMVFIHSISEFHSHITTLVIDPTLVKEKFLGRLVTFYLKLEHLFLPNLESGLARHRCDTFADGFRHQVHHIFGQSIFRQFFLLLKV